MQIKSQSQGIVTFVAEISPRSVSVGTVVVVTEMMKMTTDYSMPVHGAVSLIKVSTGQEVQVGDVLFEYEAADDAETDDAEKDAAKPTDPFVEELENRRFALSDQGRRARVEKRHEMGGRTARENLDNLLDHGSFGEIGGHALAAQHGTHTKEELIDRSAADGVLVGTGLIDGEPVAVLIVDYTVMAGTQGHFHHRKIDRLLELVERRKLPLILYPEGGGGRPNDTDAHQISVAQLELMTFQRLAAVSTMVPVIAVVHGYCFAGSAAFAGVAHVIIATQSARIGMGGPAMIEGGGLGSFSADEIGPAVMHAATGVVDVVCADEAEATKLAKTLFGLVIKKKVTSLDPYRRDLDEFMPQDRRAIFDMRTIIENVFDDGSFFELKRDFATNLIVGWARLDGQSIGVLANNCRDMGGAIDGAAADKAAGFIQLCQSFQIPIVSLIDTPGFMVGPEAEKTGQVSPIGRMFVEGAKFTAPLIAVIIRRAYGLGAMAMAGGSLHASDLTISWPHGEFGAMGLEGAVRLGMRDQLAAVRDEQEREQLFNKLVDELYERGKALNAATFFEIDDVIKPSETRSRLISVFRNLPD